MPALSGLHPTLDRRRFEDEDREAGVQLDVLCRQLALARSQTSSHGVQMSSELDSASKNALRAEAPSPDSPLQGSCLCGGVRYEITATLHTSYFCHCSHCQKQSGGPAVAAARVRRDGFRLLQGADLVVDYRPPTGNAKAFCRVCGSSLFGGDWPGGEDVAILLGSLDGDPGFTPHEHRYLASRAAWDEFGLRAVVRRKSPPSS